MQPFKLRMKLGTVSTLPYLCQRIAVLETQQNRRRPRGYSMLAASPAGGAPPKDFPTDRSMRALTLEDQFGPLSSRAVFDGGPIPTFDNVGVCRELALCLSHSNLSGFDVPAILMLLGWSGYQARRATANPCEITRAHPPRRPSLNHTSWSRIPRSLPLNFSVHSPTCMLVVLQFRSTERPQRRRVCRTLAPP